MGRVNTPELTKSATQDLLAGVREGKTHPFRTRCQVILLKAAGRRSADVGRITAMSEVSVNTWVKRYKVFGINGLQTRPGRGRKAKLDKEVDRGPVLAAVQAHRQRLQTAKAEWEQQSGKSVSSTALKSFLKVLVAATSG